MGNYKKLDDKDIAFIKNVIGDEERVLVGENINEEYSHDELGGNRRDIDYQITPMYQE